jgi:hypothetical protein
MNVSIAVVLVLVPRLRCTDWTQTSGLSESVTFALHESIFSTKLGTLKARHETVGSNPKSDRCLHPVSYVVPFTGFQVETRYGP